ncbi:hypothetical protein [Blastococcus montanus]|uniref:hypothetical protein n=1 Tax=Blastococcus montanus TaxID=3144973 RepID=UPI0032099378
MSYHNTFAIEDAAGYTYDVRLDLDMLEPATSIENSPPGEAEIIWNGTETVNVSNTTPGRNAPGPGVGFGVGALYRADGPFCTYAYGLGYTTQVTLEAPTAGEHCYFSLANKITDRTSFHSVPEQDVPAIMADLAAPAFVVAIVDGVPRDVQIDGAGPTCNLDRPELSGSVPRIFHSEPAGVACPPST